MSQLPILVPARNLTKSPSNVRKASDPVADAQLEVNIAAKGVRQNLIGIPVSRKKGQYRVIAGGRRLDAVHRLIEKGVFDDDYAVPVLILGHGSDAIETSLEENFFNLAMNPADTCRAFQDIIATEGKTVADVAIRFGLTERFVRSRLALSDLAEPVFEALRDGEISLTVAAAYASASSDRERQAEVFEMLKGSYYRSNADEIRRHLAEGTFSGSDPKALLVGREAYEAAGGRVHGDLFTDAETERWIDGALLVRLAAEKLAAAAEAIREREGYGEVRAVASSFVSYNDVWDLSPVTGDVPDLTIEQSARLEEIEAELEQVQASLDDGSLTEEDATLQGERLNAEYDGITKPQPVLTDEQKGAALAYLVIGPDGQPRVHEQLYSVPAAQSDVSDGDDDGLVEPDIDRAIGAPVKPVYSARLTNELAEMKSEMVRFHIASDPRFALDLATFWMADKATRAYGTGDLATELRSHAAPSPLTDYVSVTRSAEEFAKLGEGLDRSWIDIPDVRDRFDAFRGLDETARATWLAWAVARTVHAVPAGSDGAPFVDHLGVLLGIEVASWWRPTATNYFDRIGKSAILEHLEDVGGKELAGRYSASKKAALAGSAERIFAGEVPIEAEIREAAIAWVPDVMRFVKDEREAEVDTDTDTDTDAEASDGDVEPGAPDDLPQAA